MSAVRGNVSGSTSEQERRPLLPKAPTTPEDARDHEVKERTPLPLSECKDQLFAFVDVTLMHSNDYRAGARPMSDAIR